MHCGCWDVAIAPLFECHCMCRLPPLCNPSLPNTMSAKLTTIHQHLIPGAPRHATVHEYSLSAVSDMEVDFHACSRTVVGVAVELPADGARIHALALGTEDEVFLLLLGGGIPTPTQQSTIRRLLLEVQYLTGFEMVYSLFLLRPIVNLDLSGYDLSTVPINPNSGHLARPGGLIQSRNQDVSAEMVDGLWDSPPDNAVSLRAWLTAIAGNLVLLDLRFEQPLDTGYIDERMHGCFIESVTRTIRLESMNPQVRENDFHRAELTSEGSLTVQNALFKTRIRASDQTRLTLVLRDGTSVNARIQGTEGRLTSGATTTRLTSDAAISRIYVTGREEWSHAEQARYRFLAHSLKSSRAIPPFVSSIWLPGSGRGEIMARRSQTVYTRGTMNDSQNKVNAAMLSISQEDSLVVAYGPPGTGKTTVISAAAAAWQSRKVPCWIVAQSNVGVKNIAEKLLRSNIEFKLLVSKEFLYEWHEDLYEEVESVLIRSDEIPSDPYATERMLGNTTIILSTLSMLSNPRLDDIFKVVPVTTLVIDEASQIDVFEFMHLFYKFSSALTKVCFFGDPKQLPPYGAREAGLQTIFSIPHIKKTAYFLNTQCKELLCYGSPCI
ncbi:hypothetical protein BC834DRAFT_132011 [Gloeopeniophorella convolvens]|nr:hypothetical protein BC834DRAFT_132011 [Gloeopeniophorella convolvens]